MSTRLENLSKMLMQAISTGDAQTAELLVRELCSLNAILDIKPRKRIERPLNFIRLQVNIENSGKDPGHVTLDVPNNITIQQLKQKMLIEHEIPMDSQVWTGKRQILQNDVALDKLGLDLDETNPIYLYQTQKSPVTKY